MESQVAASQFLSRATIQNGPIGTVRSSPKQRPDIIFDVTLEIVDKPFEINFAQLPPQRPSIGAYQYVDNEADVYMSRRWPKCVSLQGTVRLPEVTLTSELIKHLLTYLQKLLWAEPDFADQRATIAGYRREFFNRQFFDIAHNRRPSSRESYVPTDTGDPLGPGVATVPEVGAFDNINELVWTPALSFPNRTTVDADLPVIRKIVADLRTHYNGYNELQDAERHISNGEVKAAVRSAASAVDAILRYYSDFWSSARPPRELPFDEKIESVLRDSGRPSYRNVADAGLDQLLYLYKARNSMHEGDCCYADRAANLVRVTTIDQVRPFVEAVIDFICWIDALA